MNVEEKFKEIENILYSKHSQIKKNGIDHIKKILDRMGNPHRRIGRIVHITGTNGKGSVAWLISKLLSVKYKKVGLYTSPHVYSITERIKINGCDISKDDFIRLYEYIISFDSNLSFFEIMTLMMIKYFEENNVDFSVIEVGIGGLFDTTNVVDGELCFITSVSYDHMDMLGSSLNDIAFQKAGIIKNGSVCIVGNVRDEQFNIIKKVADEKKAVAVRTENNFNVKGINEEFRMVVEDKKTAKVFSMLPVGLTQTFNLSMVIKGLEMIGIDLTRDEIYNAVKNNEIPARFQILRFPFNNSDKIFIIDGAHNPEAVSVFIDNVRYFGFDKKDSVLIFSLLSTKDYNSIIKEIAASSLFKNVIVTQINNPKKLSPYMIADIFSKYNCYADIYIVEDSQQAVKLALKKSDYIYSVGSFYLASEIIDFIQKNKCVLR